ncbi:hypothetical protein RI054_16g75540 [Pseudoscourfieldia marina]
MNLSDLTHSLLDGALHWFFHAFAKSRLSFLRRICYWHMVHHYYFNRRLQFNEQYFWDNFLINSPQIWLCKGFSSASIYCILPTNYNFWFSAVMLSRWTWYLLFDDWLKLLIWTKDSLARNAYNQQHKVLHEISSLNLDEPFFTLGNYHILHHIYPKKYLNSGSYKFFDAIFGHGFSLKGRKLLFFSGSQENYILSRWCEIVGASGKFVHQDTSSQKVLASEECDIAVFYDFSVTRDSNKIASLLEGNEHFFPPEVWIVVRPNNAYELRKWMDQCKSPRPFISRILICDTNNTFSTCKLACELMHYRARHCIHSSPSFSSVHSVAEYIKYFFLRGLHLGHLATVFEVSSSLILCLVYWIWPGHNLPSCDR